MIPYPLAHGVDGYAGFSYGSENGARALYPSVWDAKLPTYADGSDHLPNGTVRYFIVRDPAFSGPFRPAAYQARVRQVSEIMDATNPDLSAFASHGGKLIMAEAAADYVQSPQTGYDYYEAVRKTLGPTATDNFLRLYVTPGVGHYGQGKMADGSAPPTKVDMLAVLDSWVEGGAAPGSLIQTSYTAEASPTPVAARPLCRYPAHPQYVAGDPSRAESFRCQP